MLSVSLMPAAWRHENNIYTVKMMGYILFVFFDVNDGFQVDTASKRTFVVTPKNMDALLDLDPRAPFDAKDANEELILYKPMSSDVLNIMKVVKNEDRTYNFSYCEMDERD